MLLLNRAVDSAHLHVLPPFKAPSGGGLGKPPANYVKGAGSNYSAFFYSQFKQTENNFLLSLT